MKEAMRPKDVPRRASKPWPKVSVEGRLCLGVACMPKDESEHLHLKEVEATERRPYLTNTFLYLCLHLHKFLPTVLHLRFHIRLVLHELALKIND